MPTLGVIDHRTMHACAEFGKVLRVEGKHVIFSCKKLGEATMFEEPGEVRIQMAEFRRRNRQKLPGQVQLFARELAKLD